MKRLLLLVAAMLVLTFSACEWWEDDPVIPPVLTPEDFLFFVDIQARYVGGVIGTNGTIEVSCSPQQHASCGGGCIYKLSVDGGNVGSTLFGTTFTLVLPSDPLPYVFQCVHEASGSKSDSASVLVP